MRPDIRRELRHSLARETQAGPLGQQVLRMDAGPGGELSLIDQ